jgi:hypothetical protein
MNDLHSINSNNAAAVQRAIPSLLAQGKWVVAEYAGLTYVDCRSFDTAGQASTHLEEMNAQGIPGARYVLLEPTVVPGTHLAGNIRPIDAVTA